MVADGFLSGVLDSRKYNSAVRGHKLMYEAIKQFAWNGFLEKTEADVQGHLDEALLVLQSHTININHEILIKIESSESFRHVMQLFVQYVDFLKSGNGSSSAFWMSYMNLIYISLGFFHSTQEEDWCLHLWSINELIPWYLPNTC